jgi:hypothetical protein
LGGSDVETAAAVAVRFAVLLSSANSSPLQQDESEMKFTH